jgi:hypothetical protein
MHSFEQLLGTLRRPDPRREAHTARKVPVQTKWLVHPVRVGDLRLQLDESLPAADQFQGFRIGRIADQLDGRFVGENLP